MSREIKFRAWLKSRWEDDEDAGKMYYDIQDSYDNLGHVKPYDPMTSFTDWFDDDVAIVEQYTGLKDKNGKEIYEGDVVSWLNPAGEPKIYEIYFSELKAAFLMNPIASDECIKCMSDKKTPYIEVIDNIHENPELLGGGE